MWSPNIGSLSIRSHASARLGTTTQAHHVHSGPSCNSRVESYLSCEIRTSCGGIESKDMQASHDNDMEEKSGKSWRKKLGNFSNFSNSSKNIEKLESIELKNRNSNFPV